MALKIDFDPSGGAAELECWFRSLSRAAFFAIYLVSVGCIGLRRIRVAALALG